MTVSSLAMYLVVAGLVILLPLSVLAMAAMLRWRAGSGEVSSPARVVWTLVPAILVAALLCSLVLEGRIRL